MSLAHDFNLKMGGSNLVDAQASETDWSRRVDHGLQSRWLGGVKSRSLVGGLWPCCWRFGVSFQLWREVFVRGYVSQRQQETRSGHQQVDDLLLSFLSDSVKSSATRGSSLMCGSGSAGQWMRTRVRRSMETESPPAQFSLVSDRRGIGHG